MMDFHAIVQPTSDNSSESGPSSSCGFGKPYEDVAGQLAEIPRLHIELDGAFVWVSAKDVSHRVNGQITDDGSEVMYIEFRGRATSEEIQPIIAPLRGQTHELAFQWLPSGEMLGEQEFLDRVG